MFKAQGNISHLTAMPKSQSLEDLAQELGVDSVRRLTLNENLYGPSPKIRQGLAAWTLEEASRYPDSYLTDFRQDLAIHHQVADDQLVITNGLDEMLQLLARGFVGPDCEVVVHRPTFPEYGFQAMVDGAKIIEIENTDQQRIDYQGILDAITDKTQLLYLCNPNNPTGETQNRDFLEEIIRQIPATVLILVDEAYVEFVDTIEAVTCVPLIERYSNVAVLRTFSKAYGLANIRCGYGIFSADIARQLNVVRTPFNVSTLVANVAQAALDDTDHLAKVREAYQTERQEWMRFFDQHQVRYVPSQASFIYFQLDQAAAFIQAAYELAYLITTHTYPDWIRLALPKAEDRPILQELLLTYL